MDHPSSGVEAGVDQVLAHAHDLVLDVEGCAVRPVCGRLKRRVNAS
jgi:hypothetical protein